jgi:CheY-like chemotaxis protein
MFSSTATVPPGPRSEETGRSSLDGCSLAGTKVLVVDDDYRNLFAMRALLEGIRATVKTAESGEGAFLALDRAPDINIVPMDIMMPIMDGYEVIRRIRTRERCKSLPIIAVTGKVVSGERQRCLDAGANDYVPKPVHRAQLFGAMQPWLSADPDRADSLHAA